MKSVLLSIFIILFASRCLSGQESVGPQPRRSVTTHNGIFNGRQVSFTAIAEETFLYGDNEKDPVASIITFSYIKGSCPLSIYAVRVTVQ